MTPRELETMREMSGILARRSKDVTRRIHARMLGLWEEFASELGLRDCESFVGVAWVEWLRAKGWGDSRIRREGLFPPRCLELLEQLRPGSVGKGFVVPRGMLAPSRPEYRDAVLPEALLRRLVAVCVGEIRAAERLTPDTLVALVVLFAIRTGMNPDSILRLPRGCLTPRGGGFALRWTKARSAGDMLDFYRRAKWGPVEIVERLAALNPDGPRLFSLPGRSAFDATGRLPGWCAARNLPAFRLRDIRPAMATLIYRRSRGSVPQVQRFLHHRSPSTTMLYLAREVVGPMNEAALVRAQNAMFARWGVPEGRA